MSRRVITDANAPNPIGAYNQAVIANGFIFTAGQIAIDPATGKLIEESFKARVHQVFTVSYTHLTLPTILLV